MTCYKINQKQYNVRGEMKERKRKIDIIFID